MVYKYKHFIPQNIAPSGAKSIGVYNQNSEKICTIPLDRLAPTTKEKLYSFGLLADIHLFHLPASWNPNPKFDNALTYFDNKKCAMCIIAGDLTQAGFYMDKTENGVTTYYYDEGQFAVYEEICNKHTTTVYELCGNHESMFSKPITDNLAKLKTYTGKGVLSYTISNNISSEKNEQVLDIGDDLFILLGQPTGSEVMSDTDFQWLCETLEANKNRRCFLFVHAYIEEDSGDPLDVRENSIFEYWGATKKTAFMNLIKQYENIILFHGHSHMKFQYQELDKSANYTNKNGFKSVHIPSLSTPRDIDIENNKSVDDRSASQGYIVDVYDDCIVLTGMDFINEIPIPVGTYRINTTL